MSSPVSTPNTSPDMTPDVPPASAPVTEDGETGLWSVAVSSRTKKALKSQPKVASASEATKDEISPEIKAKAKAIAVSAPKESSSLVKTVKAVKPMNAVQKKKAYMLAFETALNDVQLSPTEISDLWAEYRYMIDDRTGYPHDHIPLRLPRERKVTKKVVNPVTRKPVT